ncbi:YbbR-like domain-containing protein [Candidatus Borrelia fainii]|uniref:YbbR-like domain-containing protein n=1 Tax=Candidatus Borrelia fainii TaxID=2518322 RepID=A0ABN6USD6_9SPIR|nr:YbbR-like domain-containing protein [Candidatus Borrelia fainii]BDU63302.1 YbbR-like domain-containing protein [Candidatus Borrelia fainii]
MIITKKFINIIKLLFEDWQNKAISILIAIIMFTTSYFNSIESIAIEKKFNILLEDEVTLGKIPDFNKILLTVKINKKDLKYLDLDRITLLVEANNIKKAGEYELPIKIKNFNPIPIVEYKLSKNKITLSLDKKISKLVKVEPKFKLLEKEGKGEYFIAKYNIVPEKLKIHGPEKVIKTINSIKTKIKEFDTNTVFISEHLEVISPTPLITLDKNHVILNITLGKKYIHTTIKNPNLIFNNLKNGLEIKNKEKILDPENEMFIKIRSGLSENIIKMHIANKNISFNLDLSQIETPGIYDINTDIILKNNTHGIEVYEYEPKTINIEVISTEQ